jgi:allophanate hydrolase
MNPSRPASTVAAAHDPIGAVEQAYDRIAAAGRDEVWIELRERSDALAEAAKIDRRCQAGERLALAGYTVAVKDNIDVGGLPTTAACPPFGYLPVADAPVVGALRRAGAVVLGKTNMDQFATGLVGTRSPHGAVRDARHPRRVSGGSSSGSAVAVALGMADIGLGTDTAGSGRVPAAFQGIYGIKPTRALLGTLGVVPACRSFDCLSLFVAELGVGEAALAAVESDRAGDWRSSSWAADAPLRAPAQPAVAIADAGQLGPLSRDARRAYAAAARRLEAGGAQLSEIDIAPLLEAGALLYDGAFVAERYAAVGGFIEAHPGAADPTVASIILAAKSVSAGRYLADWERLRSMRAVAAPVLAGFDALLLPTAPYQPTITEVGERPNEVNRELGRYTTFCNLLEMCALAIPAGDADGGQFGVTLLAPAFHDRVLWDLAPDVAYGGVAAGGPAPGGAAMGPPSVALMVVGAHLSGQPLNGQLVDRGAVLIGSARTADRYRLYRLGTEPPKPGLVRCPPTDPGGAAITGELWGLAPAALAQLLADLPRPMTFGHIELQDGSEVVGFLCEPEAVPGAPEITAHGGWLAYLAAAAA